MSKALVVIDIQNDITKHYRDIIDKINDAISWAQSQGMYIVYINLDSRINMTRLVPQLRVLHKSQPA